MLLDLIQHRVNIDLIELRVTAEQVHLLLLLDINKSFVVMLLILQVKVQACN